LDEVADYGAVCYAKRHQLDCNEKFRKKTTHDFRQCPVIQYDKYVGMATSNHVWRLRMLLGMWIAATVMC
jgi:hypothetical protein